LELVAFALRLSVTPSWIDRLRPAEQRADA
jgi:hypothetical protein